MFIKKFAQHFYGKNFGQMIKINHKNFGFFDRIAERKKKKQIKEEFDFFLDRNTFTFADYKDYVQRQIDQQNKNVLRRLFSRDEKSMEELLENKKLLSVLVEEEIQNPWLVVNSPKIQKEIALVCQVPEENVQSLIENFKQTYVIHYWFRQRKKNNKRMPESQEEFQLMIRHEPNLPYRLKVEQNRKIKDILKLRQKSEKRKLHYEKEQEAMAKKNQEYVWVKRNMNYK